MRGRLLALGSLGILALGLIAFSLLVQAQQEPIEAEARSEALLHWMYIAMEDKDSLMAQYDENAEFYWVGGPLTGLYEGIDEISALWDRFFAGNEEEHVRASSVRVINLGEELVVFADVSFIVVRAQTGDRILLDLTYLIVFRAEDGMLKIEEEWWIIDSASPLS